MKIYFAASIRGGRADQEIYRQIISLLSEYGMVLTEHFGQSTIKAIDGTGKDSRAIFQEDMELIIKADAVVAEVTQPSLGVGYELAQAEFQKKPTLCLFRENSERSLSAMIAGNLFFTVANYQTIEDARPILDRFFAGK